VRNGSCVGDELPILKMENTTNAHAGTTSGSSYNYRVCCNGLTGLGTNCSGTYTRILRLSSTDNAHVQSSAGSYGTSICISGPDGTTFSYGYQPTNCDGYDTTVASMKSTDNSHIGDASAYSEYKICATAAPAAATSITFSVSDNSIGFGSLNSGAARYATGNTNGSSSDTTDAHTLTASTDATNGYVITITGSTLTCSGCGGTTISAIGGTATASSTGTNQFGLRLIVNSGTGTATSPYASSNWAFDTAAIPSQVASGSGTGLPSEFGVRYIANISASKMPGVYRATLSYTATGSF